MKRKWTVIFLGLFILSVFVQAQLSRNFEEEFLASSSGQALMQVYAALKSNYLNDVNDESLIQGAIKGMIDSLDDRFSYYSDPEAAARRNQDMSGSFEGIGAVLSPLNRQSGKGVEIINVYKDGPAWQAGLRRGDIFVEVDGTDVSDMTPSEVADLVRGPKGSMVAIKMLRQGEEEAIDFLITRGQIAIVSVESTVLDNHVGYIHLTTFSNQMLYDQLMNHLSQLKEQGIQSLILDLRDNGGGLLSQGIQVADAFLDKGDIVFQRSKGVTSRLASADPEWFDLPMVVLVNDNSASASEIVAGALQENHRALVVGEDTFGKGVAQNVISLSNGGQLAYVSFEWLTPNRNSISEVGITPDVYAEDTRFPDVVSLEGQGHPGQVIEFSVDGQAAGSVIVGEDGSFEFVSTGKRAQQSEIQGEAIVDLLSDNALHIAFDTLNTQVEAKN
ncbi:MAG: S41 family peptidase [Trueperaceae bacterium]|nr:S41 family peptidase [Trueperaceae bacterium]